MPHPLSQHFAYVNGIRLHYVEAGAGPLVVLLHGFPEFWYSWHHQLDALAAAGFRAVAPDLRGYNESDKPHGVSAYRIEYLTADIAALIRHLGESSAHIVGHDWGGVVAWHLPLHHPGIVRRLAILNAPHPALLLREIRRPVQMFRSWYIFFFLIPCLPEWTLRRGNFAGLESIFRTDPVRPGTFDDDAIARYKLALGRPGALTSALNWYRASFRRSPARALRELQPIDEPTLVLWGERDRYLDLRLLDGLERWVRQLQIVRLPEASHWVQNDSFAKVNTILIDFLNSARS
jgi:pimeloyl-ACP methyl ester carboxylesterase